jgi:hypothetical protein
LKVEIKRNFVGLQKVVAADLNTFFTGAALFTMTQRDVINCADYYCENSAVGKQRTNKEQLLAS